MSELLLELELCTPRGKWGHLQPATPRAVLPVPALLLSADTGDSSPGVISGLLLLGKGHQKAGAGWERSQCLGTAGEIVWERSTPKNVASPTQGRRFVSFFRGRTDACYEHRAEVTRQEPNTQLWEVYHRHGVTRKRRWRGALSYLFCLQLLDSPVALFLLLFLLYQNRVPH